MEKPTRGKGKQVSATVSPELYDALEDYGWNNRKTRTDLVRQAVEEFAERNGILPSPTDEGGHGEHQEHHGEHHHGEHHAA
jgi:predicted transcriptional regulator